MDGRMSLNSPNLKPTKSLAPGIVVTPILDAGGAINRNFRAKISFIRSQPRSFQKKLGQDSLTEPKDNACRDANSAEECVGARL